MGAGVKRGVGELQACFKESRGHLWLPPSPGSVEAVLGWHLMRRRVGSWPVARIEQPCQAVLFRGRGHPGLAGVSQLSCWSELDAQLVEHYMRVTFPASVHAWPTQLRSLSARNLLF